MREGRRSDGSPGTDALPVVRVSGERDQLVPLDQSDAMSLYEKLPNKDASFEEAFPGVEIEDA